MIPQEILDLINGLYISYVGSCDGNRMPVARQCWGATFKGAEDIIIFVVQAQFEPILKNVQDNRRLAINLTDPGSHISYQMKGQFLKVREMVEDETILQQQYRDKLIDFVTMLGYSKEQAERYAYRADLAVEMKIEKIFNQTPGPGAGKEITA